MGELVLLSGRVSADEWVSAAEWVSSAEWVNSAEWVGEWVGECC